MSGVTPRALRQLNRAATLRALALEAQPVGMSVLAERTGLSRRTIELILDDLVGSGWATECERVPVSGAAGRPPRRFELRADNALLAAVRVTTLSASAVIADVRGRIVGRAEQTLAVYPDPDATLDLVRDLVFAALEDAGASVDKLRAGAMASGGAIDEDGVVRRLVNAELWVGRDLPRELAARIPVAWFADNDANLGALAERWRGAARDHDDIVWAILGNRGGLGFLIRGRVHRGFQGGAGELVEALRGTLDEFAARTVGFHSSPVAAERAAADALYADARAGDVLALAEIDEFARHIASILVTLTWTISPSLIVLGGGLEAGADLLLPRVQAALRDEGAPEIELRASALGADAPLIGALRFVLNRMDVELFGPVLPADAPSVRGLSPSSLPSPSHPSTPGVAA